MAPINREYGEGFDTEGRYDNGDWTWTTLWVNSSTEDNNCNSGKAMPSSEEYNTVVIPTTCELVEIRAKLPSR